MEKGNPLPFGPDSWRFVDEPDAGSAAALERVIDVGYGETDVVDAGSPPGDEPVDRRVRYSWLEQLDEDIVRGEPDDASAIGVGERDRQVGKAEYVAIEGEQLAEVPDSNSDVVDPRKSRAGGRFLQGSER